MRFVSAVLAATLLLACTDDEDQRPIEPGDYWELEIRVEREDPCPAIDFPTQLGVKVHEVDGLVVLRPADGAAIADVVISDAADHASFRLYPSWTTRDGMEVSALVIYDLTVLASGMVSGTATGEYNFFTEDGGTTCRQTFAVQGHVIRDDGRGDCKPGQVGPLCG